MTQYTVIKDDSAIYVDGVGIVGCDMSGLPSNFHALQWDGSNGQIEYNPASENNLTISSESEIESALGVSLSTLIERRNVIIAEAEEAERQRIASKELITD